MLDLPTKSFFRDIVVTSSVLEKIKQTRELKIVSKSSDRFCLGKEALKKFSMVNTTITKV